MEYGLGASGWQSGAGRRLTSDPHSSEDTPLQRKKSLELQKAWGDRPCEHPELSREYDSGERTGNYCCEQCGATLTFREKAELMARRK